MDIAEMTFLEDELATKQKSSQSWWVNSPDTTHRAGEMRGKHTAPVLVGPAGRQCQQQYQD